MSNHGHSTLAEHRRESGTVVTNFDLSSLRSRSTSASSAGSNGAFSPLRRQRSTSRTSTRSTLRSPPMRGTPPRVPARQGSEVSASGDSATGSLSPLDGDKEPPHDAAVAVDADELGRPALRGRGSSEALPATDHLHEHVDSTRVRSKTLPGAHEKQQNRVDASPPLGAAGAAESPRAAQHAAAVAAKRAASRALARARAVSRERFCSRRRAALTAFILLACAVSSILLAMGSTGKSSALPFFAVAQSAASALAVPATWLLWRRLNPLRLGWRQWGAWVSCVAIVPATLRAISVMLAPVDIAKWDDPAASSFAYKIAHGCWVFSLLLCAVVIPFFVFSSTVNDVVAEEVALAKDIEGVSRFGGMQTPSSSGTLGAQAQGILGTATTGFDSWQAHLVGQEIAHAAMAGATPRSASLMKWVALLLLAASTGVLAARPWGLKQASWSIPVVMVAWVVALAFDEGKHIHRNRWYLCVIAFLLMWWPTVAGTALVRLLDWAEGDPTAQLIALAGYHSFLAVISVAWRLTTTGAVATSKEKVPFDFAYRWPAELLSEFVFVEVSPLSPTFFAVVLATRAKDCVSFLGLHRDSFDYIRRHISYWRNGGKPTPSKVERLEMKRRRAEVGYRRWRRAEHSLFADMSATACVATAVAVEWGARRGGLDVSAVLTSKLDERGEVPSVFLGYAIIILLQIANTSLVRRLLHRKLDHFRERAQPKDMAAPQVALVPVSFVKEGDGGTNAGASDTALEGILENPLFAHAAQRSDSAGTARADSAEATTTRCVSPLAALPLSGSGCSPRAAAIRGTSPGTTSRLSRRVSLLEDAHWHFTRSLETFWDSVAPSFMIVAPAGLLFALSTVYILSLDRRAN